MTTRKNQQPSEESDALLMQRVAANDKEAINKLLLRYDRLIGSVVARIISNNAAREDACQMARLSIFRAAPQYESHRGAAVSSWIARITVNRCLDYLRGNRRYLRVAGQDDSAAIEEVADVANPELEAITQASFRRALDAYDELSDDEREVYQLVHVERLSAPQAAQQLNIPVGTVNSRLYRARKHLAAAMSLALAGCSGLGTTKKALIAAKLAAGLAAGVSVAVMAYFLRGPLAPHVIPENLPNPDFDRLISGRIYFHRFTDNAQQPGPSYQYQARHTASQLLMETSAVTQPACRILQASREVLLICESSARAQSSHVDLHVGRITSRGVRLKSYLIDAPLNHFIGGGTGALTASSALHSCFVAFNFASRIDPVGTIRRVCARHRSDPFCEIPVAHFHQQQERILIDGSDEIVIRFHAEVDAPEWNGEITVASDSLRSAPQICRGRICDLMFRSGAVSGFNLTARYSGPLYLFDARSLTPAQERTFISEDPCNRTGP